MAGRYPASVEPFDVLAWLRDTRVLSLEARGAWIDVLCLLWTAKPRGRYTQSLEAWARYLGLPEDAAAACLLELLTKGVAEIPHGRDALQSRDRGILNNAGITLVSRRIIRTDKLRRLNRIRQQRYRNNAGITQQNSVTLVQSDPEKSAMSQEANAAPDAEIINSSQIGNAEITICPPKSDIYISSSYSPPSSLKSEESSPSNESPPLFGSPSQPPKKERRKPRTAWPQGLALTPALEAYAREKGMADQEIRTEWELFEHHHVGAGSMFADWERAWYKWVLKWQKMQAARKAAPRFGDRRTLRPVPKVSNGGSAYGQQVAALVRK